LSGVSGFIYAVKGIDADVFDGALYNFKRLIIAEYKKSSIKRITFGVAVSD
jgi:hypothetical protein